MNDRHKSLFHYVYNTIKQNKRVLDYHQHGPFCLVEVHGGHVVLAELLAACGALPRPVAQVLVDALLAEQVEASAGV